MAEYKGHEYEVERRQCREIGMEYDFHLVVDGDDVISASHLENRGNDGPEDSGRPWASQLREYAEAYIDGMEAQ